MTALEIILTLLVWALVVWVFLDARSQVLKQTPDPDADEKHSPPSPSAR